VKRYVLCETQQQVYHSNLTKTFIKPYNFILAEFRLNDKLP